jgi:DNA primase
MPFVSDELFYEICAANDIIDYASSFMNVKKNGKNYVACCPFHNEKTPSFSIDRDKQLFHCFGCGASGNFVQLVMRLEGLDYRDALHSLADRAGISIPENGKTESDEFTKKKDRIIEMNRIAARFFYDCLADPQTGRAAREYFAARKLSKNTIIKFGLGYAPDSKNALLKYLNSKGYKDEEIIQAGLAVTRNSAAVDKYRNRVMFPIINVRGKVIGFGGRVLGSNVLDNGFKIAKYLNSPQTPVFDKGSNLFALNLAKNSNEKDLILCEGYMDVITVHQAGITNCVATLGTAITDAQAKLMLRYGNNILICYDMDEAGTTAALRAIDIILAAGGKARVIRITGAKDPDEYITKYGVSGFKKAIDKAVPSTEFKISLIKKKYDINDTEGKIRFVEETAQVLAKLTDTVEVEAYIKKTAAETGISEQSIFGKYTEYRNKSPRLSPVKTKEEYKRREVNTVNSQKPPQERVTSGVLEAEKRVLSLMAKSRRLCLRAFEIMQPDEFSNNVYSSLAKSIYQCAKAGVSVEGAAVINKFSGDIMAENMAAEIFFNNEEYSDNETTLYDLIYTIKQNKLNAKMNASADPHEIDELIKAKNELDLQRRRWQRNT